MSKALSIVWIVIVLACPSIGQGLSAAMRGMMGAVGAVSPIPRDGLVAEYLFASNGNDTSGNAINATLFGDALASGVLTTSGTGYGIAGTTNTFAFVHSNGFFTISAWFRQEVAPGGTVRFIAGTSRGSGSLDGFDLYTFNNNLLARLDLSAGTDYTITATGGWATNTWHHVAWTGDGSGSTSRLYLDGVQVGTATVATNAVASTYPLGLASAGSAEFKWTGKIDAVRIYNRALATNEVAQLYAEGAPE